MRTITPKRTGKSAMFSMKYTSPKVTPKKGPPPPPAFGPSAWEAFSSSSSAADDRRSPPSSSVRAPPAVSQNSSLKSLAVGFSTGEDYAARSLPRHFKRINHGFNGAHLASNSNQNQSNRRDRAIDVGLMTENDSAVANTPDEAEPRGSNNLLALLDRDYSNDSGSGPGELSAKNTGSGESSDKNALKSDISEEAEPRDSSLLALLDRDYSNGSGSGELSAKNSGSGESSAKNTLKSDQHAVDGGDDIVEAATATHCSEDNGSVIADDGISKADDAEGAIGNGDGVIGDPSTININSPGGYLRGSSAGSFEYHRSTSMEPLFDEGSEDPVPSARAATSEDEPSPDAGEEGADAGAPRSASSASSGSEEALTSGSEESIEVTPFAGKAGSLHIPFPLDRRPSDEEMNDDARSVSPILGGERNQYPQNPYPPSPTIYDMSGQPASPLLSEFNAVSEICGDTYFDEPRGRECQRTPVSEVASSVYLLSSTAIRSPNYFDGPGGSACQRTPVSEAASSVRLLSGNALRSPGYLDESGGSACQRTPVSEAASSVCLLTSHALRSPESASLASHAEESKRRANSVDAGHVPLPPRVNRTTADGRAAAIRAPFLPDCPSTPTQNVILPRTLPRPSTAPRPLFPKQRSLPAAPSPRKPSFCQTHSLLDDCSDEEETSFTIVDSPTRPSSYSCLPRPYPRARSQSEGRGGLSPFSAYFRNKNKRGREDGRRSSSSSSSTSGGRVRGPGANRVASDKIHQALLRTRHRRWDCQSAYAGSHARSSRVLDLSHRVHHVSRGGASGGRESRGGRDGGDGGPVARLSVSAGAVRAAALASGQWRTVRLVKLPRGLFRMQHDDDGCPKGNEVWALLKMLHSTFPDLTGVDFGGDIFGGPTDDSHRGRNDDAKWRREILTGVVECLPNVASVDGIVAGDALGALADGGDLASAKEAGGREGEASDVVASGGSGDGRAGSSAVESTAACVVCESVPMCGLSELVEDEGRGIGLLNASTDTTVGDGGLDVELESVALESVASTEAAPAIERRASRESNEDEAGRITSAISPSSSGALSSSRSWGSAGSGSRPPTCPASSAAGCSRRGGPSPRLPANPKDGRRSARGGSFSRAGSGLKRRVLGLIPTVSMMDDEEDEESEGEDGSDDEDDCPTDLL